MHGCAPQAGGTGLGGVGKQALTRIGGDREGLEWELKIPDDRVVDELDGVDPAQEAGRSALRSRPWNGEARQTDT
jgi:hypothetical protein